MRAHNEVADKVENNYELKGTDLQEIWLNIEQ